MPDITLDTMNTDDSFRRSADDSVPRLIAMDDWAERRRHARRSLVVLCFGIHIPGLFLWVVLPIWLFRRLFGPDLSGWLLFACGLLVLMATLLWDIFFHVTIAQRICRRHRLVCPECKAALLPGGMHIGRYGRARGHKLVHEDGHCPKCHAKILAIEK